MAENINGYDINYTFDGLRDYLLLNDINSLYEMMTTEELKGASIVIRTIATHLSKKHFQEQRDIDIHALIKTIEDLGDISVEMLLNERNVIQKDNA